MTNYLFNEFKKASPKEWKQKIQYQLKGDDYNKKLLWNTEEQITVRPFYTKEDRTLQDISLPKNSFNICQTIFIDDEIVANSLAKKAIDKGVTAICFKANKTFNYKKVISKINIKSVVIYFDFSFLDSKFVTEISQFYNSQNIYFNTDIIGNLAKTGNYYLNLKNDHEKLYEIVKSTNNSINVNTSTYQNSGANIVQELAYALAHANEYLTLFKGNFTSKIHFKFSVGSNYFFEIAKLRAFRMLWSLLLKQYNIENNDVHVFTQPSLRNKTIYDYSINISRITTECMSAIIGGTNTISNFPFDGVSKKINEFSEQFSHNQLLFLKDKSFFSEAQHFANGTYYIESITEQLAEKALTIFKTIEHGGGFLKQLKNGIIQRKIKESASTEQMLFDSKNSSKYNISKNKTISYLELFPFVKKRYEKTIIQPIIPKRLAEKLEQERLQNE